MTAAIVDVNEYGLGLHPLDGSTADAVSLGRPSIPCNVAVVDTTQLPGAGPMGVFIAVSNAPRSARVKVPFHAPTR